VQTPAAERRSAIIVRPTVIAGGCLLAVAIAAAEPTHADAPPLGEDRPWSVTVYGGPLVDERFVRIVTFRARGDVENSYLVTAALGREFARLGEVLRFEVEGQLGRHFGRQHHWEFNAALVARWTWFPWDRYLDTSVAVGEGLSFATERPPLERDDGRRDNPRLLNYLMAEIELGLPDEPAWRLVTRVHHRSPVSGLFGEASGTNFVTLGLRHRF
jgi:hypothetical protein